MGTWGFGILENDSALDVYGDFIDLYNVDTPTGEIRPQIEPGYRWAVNEELDYTNYWCGLAQAQWECQTLDDDVLAKIELIVGEDRELSMWDADDYPKRRTALKRFLTKIRKPKAKPKKRVAPKFLNAPFQKGDCIAFQHHSGDYGGVLCLAASPKPQKIATNIIALLRIRQKSVPTVDDFLDSHVLIKRWRFADGRPAVWSSTPTPEISTIGVSSLAEWKAARELKVAGSLEVQRDFGESAYGFHMSWEWDDVLDDQFACEEEDPRTELDQSIPVRKLISAPEPGLQELGKRFAASQAEHDDFAEYRKQCRAFRKHMATIGFTEGLELNQAIADYAGLTYQRAANRVGDILQNAK